MSAPEIALLVSTYERPRHLRRALASIAAQRDVAGLMEVVVTDDGSRDETPEVVREFAATVDFPVRMTTHPHGAFQLARSRNEGVAASTAPYLLFLDGDCLLPPDHVRVHLERRQPGVVQGGHFIALERAVSEQITEHDVATGDFMRHATWSERWSLLKMDLAARWHNFIGHPDKPRLFGNNVGIWRTDYQRVNGYDENFVGWGGEDDDLRLRLRRAGLRVESILWWTCTYHLWHPKTPCTPNKIGEGSNIAYLHRPARLTRCGNGLVKRSVADLRVALAGPPQCAEWLQRVFAPGQLAAGALPTPLAPRDVAEHHPAEVELLFLPGEGTFSGSADCRIAVVIEPTPATLARAQEADLALCDRPLPQFPAERLFRLGELSAALGSLLARTAAKPAQAA